MTNVLSYLDHIEVLTFIRAQLIKTEKGITYFYNLYNIDDEVPVVGPDTFPPGVSGRLSILAGGNGYARELVEEILQEISQQFPYILVSPSFQATGMLRTPSQILERIVTSLTQAHQIVEQYLNILISGEDELSYYMALDMHEGIAQAQNAAQWLCDAAGTWM
jgi:hypothetical protein